MKPDFSNTRTDAGLLAKTSPEIRWSGKLSKQESVTAVTASVMIPRPQNWSPYQYNPLPLYADTRPGPGEHRSRRRPYPQSERKISCRLFGYRSLQEFVCVLDRVRMREEIAYRQPDFAIVRVACYRLAIIEPPRAYRASFEHELHRLLVIELDTRFLHFAIRQQPHKRFVMKIDHLNPITPGIAKVAAERRLQFEF